MRTAFLPFVASLCSAAFIGSPLNAPPRANAHACVSCTNHHINMAPAAQPVGIAPRHVLAHAGHAKFWRSHSPRMEAFSFDPFDRDVFRILMDAQSEARVLGAAQVGTEHLLLAATMQKDDTQAALQRVGVTADGIRDHLRGGKGGGMAPGLERLFATTAKDELLPFAKDTERALKSSVNRSKEPGGSLSRDSLISWRELMMSILADEAADTGALKALNGVGVERDTVYKAVESGERELVGAGRGGERGKNTTLAQCSVDLTQKVQTLLC